MTGDDERIAIIEADLRNHVKNYEATVKRVEENGTEIKAMIRELSVSLKTSVERLHTVREEDRDKATVDLNFAVSKTVDKIEEIGVIARDAHRRIDGQRIWILSGVIGAILLAISMVGWVWDHVIKGAS